MTDGQKLHTAQLLFVNISVQEGMNMVTKVPPALPVSSCKVPPHIRFSLSFTFTRPTWIAPSGEGS